MSGVHRAARDRGGHGQGNEQFPPLPCGLVRCCRFLSWKLHFAVLLNFYFVVAQLVDVGAVFQMLGIIASFPRWDVAPPNMELNFRSAHSTLRGLLACILVNDPESVLIANYLLSRVIGLRQNDSARDSSLLCQSFGSPCLGQLTTKWQYVRTLPALRYILVLATRSEVELCGMQLRHYRALFGYVPFVTDTGMGRE
mmetsp:Transcript_13518/g.39452  ORF Transcript_13518/g.39452 Transcript_13518/m.39452 type:complete len:197 (+) Transcript_13518:128-718(+)